jgi:hypothetical protein
LRAPAWLVDIVHWETGARKVTPLPCFGRFFLTYRRVRSNNDLALSVSS